MDITPIGVQNEDARDREGAGLSQTGEPLAGDSLERVSRVGEGRACVQMYVCLDGSTTDAICMRTYSLNISLVQNVSRSGVYLTLQEVECKLLVTIFVNIFM